jgi:hypothetical protein
METCSSPRVNPRLWPGIQREILPAIHFQNSKGDGVRRITAAGLITPTRRVSDRGFFMAEKQTAYPFFHAGNLLSPIAFKPSGSKVFRIRLNFSLVLRFLQDLIVTGPLKREV